MPTVQEQLQTLSPEERTRIVKNAKAELSRRQTGESKGPSPFLRDIKGILPAAGRGIRAGVEALPSILAGQVPPTKGISDLETLTVGRFDPITGEVTTVETDADKILRGAVEKPEAELKSTDLINIYKILSTEPPTKPGAFLGIGEQPGDFTPEQVLLREQAKALLDRNAARVEISGEFSDEEETLIKENIKAHKKTRAEVISALRQKGLLP